MGAQAAGRLGGATVERTAGRVALATNRIEGLRRRIESAIGASHVEVDRLVGMDRPPSNEKADSPLTAAPPDIYALEQQCDLLERTLALAEQLAGRLTAV